MTDLQAREGNGPVLPLLFAALSLLLLLAFPSVVAQGVQGGLSLAYRSVLPAVLPFMVVADLLSALDLRLLDKTVCRPIATLLGISPCGARAVIIGILGGFPIGARIASNLYLHGVIEKPEAERLLYLSSVASPAFVISGVGLGMLGDAAIGVKLYCITLLSHLSVAFIFRRKFKKRTERTNHRLPAKSLGESIEGAAGACIRIAAYLAFFSACSALVANFLPQPMPSVLIASVLEIGSGAHAIVRLGALTIPLLAFCITFSGLSIYLQIKSYASKAEIKMKPYLLGKLSSALLAALVAMLFPS